MKIKVYKTHVRNKELINNLSEYFKNLSDEIPIIIDTENIKYTDEDYCKYNLKLFFKEFPKEKAVIGTWGVDSENTFLIDLLKISKRIQDKYDIDVIHYNFSRCDVTPFFIKDVLEFNGYDLQDDYNNTDGWQIDYWFGFEQALNDKLPFKATIQGTVMTRDLALVIENENIKKNK